MTELYTALNHPLDFKKALTLIKQGVDPTIYLKEEASWGTLGDALYHYDNSDVSREVIFELLRKGVAINPPEIEDETPLHALIKYSSPKFLYYFELIQYLLQSGANPNIITNMPFDGNILVDAIKNLKNSKLLLDYGALYNKAIPKGFSNTNALHYSQSIGEIKSVKLLLDYGADTMSVDGYSYMIDYGNCKDMVFDDIKLTDEECEELKSLLNPNNPPYLKLGELNEDKYIIYENKLIEEEGYLAYPQPFLLADKHIYQDKKYLYSDNKIDAFIYWCYKNKMLDDRVIKVVEIYVSQKEFDYHSLEQLAISTIGERITTELFKEEGKEFATHYLTVTHWWYNLHTDFNRLFNEKDKKPKAIESKKEFDTLVKLLDIRYEQFKSKKDFNSNQNKEELEALLEGRETPKRVVDLSWLEEGEEEQTPIPLIHLKSNQPVPKTGCYQATLAKGHEKEKLLKESGFDIKKVQEGESIGTFGLSGSDESDIVWVYLGE
jgi:hypothetical protein